MIVPICLRCSWRERRLDVSALTSELADRGEGLSRFGFEGVDPIGIAPWRELLNGWISIGVGARFFGIPAIL